MHMSKLLHNVKFYFRGFARSCRLLTEDSRKLLYNAAIASRLNYCDAVWDGCSSEFRDKLQTVQNRCARRILNRLPGTSAAPLLRKLGWMSLADKRTLHKCVLLHRILLGNGPEALKRLLTIYSREVQKTTRSVTNGNFFIPGFNTNYFKKSFILLQ